jgi:hypothetical protein
MEILVRVVDKYQPDPEKNHLVSKRGDVIAVCPDGWGWSLEERTSPDWRIISSPILNTFAEVLMQTDLLMSGRLKRRRQWTLDFSVLPNPQLFEGGRTQEIIPVSRLNMAKATLKKT